ncbi:uncharacterized protein LOC119379010 isoform X2 [Rhipicephalus sanguineus]|uniref:uncharacterized protein LOC119379010 isoform X2 n=1 Tax=Rhipicephalus sanguineus TaxID=34632 RepID=UPI0020C289A3|nr:uncharacterized protein LOC119379010 isoform X2 [Rhipicephalus sanguineus]
MVECRNPGCRGKPVPKVGKSMAFCPACRLPNCLECDAIHDGMSCKAYKRSIGADDSPAASRGGQTPTRRDTSPRPSTSAATSGTSQKKTAAPVMANEDSSEVLVYCKVTDCEGVGFVGKDDTMFRCIVCSHFTCVKCSAFHESMTCAEYQKNKDNVVVPVYKPTGLPEEDNGESEAEEPEVLEADDDAERVIVDCRHNGCKGYSYVVKTATTAQCEMCKHWTCVACKACHESQTCAQHLGIELPTEPPVPSSAFQLFPSSQKQIQKPRAGAGSSEGPGAYIWERATEIRVRNMARQLFRGGKSDDMEDEPAGAVAAPRGYENSTRVQENACDACNCTKPDHVAAECEHVLCRKCIQTAVEKSTVYKFIMCPVEAGSPQQCSGRLMEDVYKKCVSPEALAHMKNMRNWFPAECFKKKCPNQGKPGSLLVKRGTESYVCPHCLIRNCWACRAIHNDMTCGEYMEKLVADMDAGKLEDPHEKEKRYRELVSVYEQDVVTTTHEFECAICFVDVEPGKGIILKNCHHKVCEQCLADTAKNSPKAEVQCPCLENGDPCQMSVLDCDLRACLSKEEYDALQDRSLREAENRSKEPSFHCKTPDCRGWCFHDPDVELFECPLCRKQNCLRCEEIHEGMTCAQYQEDLKRRADNDAAAKASLNFLEEMLRTQQAMRCPQCRIVIIKRVGCDFMVCTSCHTQLCWATKGARWGPNGVGDTSGGCRCGVGGVKCHPTCTTCH